MYVCQICGNCSEPGAPQLRHITHRTVPKQGGGTRQEIQSETPICAACHALLKEGVPFAILLRQKGKAVRPPRHLLPTGPVGAEVPDIKRYRRCMFCRTGIGTRCYCGDAVTRRVE